MYNYGTSARKLEEHEIRIKNKSKTKRQSYVLAKPSTINKRGVIFLAFICCLTMFICVNYVQAKSRHSMLIREKAAVMTALNQIREENDDFESQINAGIDYRKIKTIAEYRLGMKKPERTDIVKYEKPSCTSHVRQYMDVPTKAWGDHG